MSSDISYYPVVNVIQALRDSMSATDTTSLTTGLPASSSSDTDALVAAVVNNVNQQELDASSTVDGTIQPSQVAESALASMPILSEGQSIPGRVPKPRARKSPGSGAKRSEPSKRKFVCSFSHYGCDVALSSKNEWKRHVSIQHLQLGFYRCDVGSCNPDNTPNAALSKKVFNDFNRKDLFTQHHRRMHKPESGPGSGNSQDPNSSDWRAFEDSLEEVRSRCWQERRKPPQRSTCGFCGRVFEGEGSWNERMEHVGSHYARDLPEASKEEREDEDLTNWSLAEGVIKETPSGRHVLIDQPASSTDRSYSNRNIDMAMVDAPPISPTNGQTTDGQFIGTQILRDRNMQQSVYPSDDVLGSGRPSSSSDRLEDLINTLINPKKPRMSKRLQWRCDCGLDCSVDFAEDNQEDTRAFANLGKISIICQNSQSPYLKTSKTEQYEIIPCNELHSRIAQNNKFATNHALPRVEEAPEDDSSKIDGDSTLPSL
ncbi:hypothetical protein LTR05_000564 [Lithohypha guttulata]|uniref:C2H2-type domain-containing protein n=1 Tax=Lithohypha guttulata TaxID=1690604 RepID=A0AAN7YE11_9EURO|nr:hypothetical protein LTR05_000564 [Lithohypha guttulata]